jgi:CubicO group peptidase (beta-lactamase class C family)
MLQALRADPVPNRVGTYQNGNFTLIRVLIGEIVYQLDETSAAYATECTEKYFEYIDQNIFSKLNLDCPASVAEVNAYYNTTTYPWAYQHPFNAVFSNPADGSLGWGHSNSPYRNGGSAGLMLSALDIAKIMAYFKHDDAELIISEARRNNILEFELGLTESTTGEHGRYPSKGGTRGPDDCCDRAIRSRIMFFPNNVEAVIITNSDHTGLGVLLRDAFDASWLSPC